MPFLSPNQQCQITEGKISHFMDLCTPSSPGGLPTLSLTTNSSWLPCGSVAMPLISSLMPVTLVIMNSVICKIERFWPTSSDLDLGSRSLKNLYWLVPGSYPADRPFHRLLPGLISSLWVVHRQTWVKSTSSAETVTEGKNRRYVQEQF